MQARDAQKLNELATAHTANLQAACAAARASAQGDGAAADAATTAYRAEYEDIMRGKRQAAAAASGPPAVTCARVCCGHSCLKSSKATALAMLSSRGVCPDGWLCSHGLALSMRRNHARCSCETHRATLCFSHRAAVRLDSKACFELSLSSFFVWSHQASPLGAPLDDAHAAAEVAALANRSPFTWQVRTSASERKLMLHANSLADVRFA